MEKCQKVVASGPLIQDNKALLVKRSEIENYKITLELQKPSSSALT